MVQCTECKQEIKTKQALAMHKKWKHYTEQPSHVVQEPVVLPEPITPTVVVKAEPLVQVKPKHVIKQKKQWVVAGAKPAEKKTVKEIAQNKVEEKTLWSMINILKKAKPMRQPIEYGATKNPHIIEYKIGSWAIIYKEDLVVREIPVIWQQDKETKQNWIIMLEQQFYGKPVSFWQLNYVMLYVPFDKSRSYVDYYGRGYLIALDEISQLQIPLHEVDDDQKLDKRLEDNAYNSQNMALYRELIIHAKKKWNWTLIIIIILVLVVLGVAAYYIYTHPNILKSIGQLAILLPRFR